MFKNVVQNHIKCDMNKIINNKLIKGAVQKHIN